MKKFIIIAIITVIAMADAIARPQYSILQTYGTKCQNCHTNIQGGGARTNPGWLSRNSISLINPGSIGLQGLFDLTQETNTAMDDKIMFGFDGRYQSANWGAPIKSERKTMLMQLSPYLTITPTDWLSFEGMYNTAYQIESDMRYMGQQEWQASATIKPFEDLPSVRVGYFQPTIGTKYDDHTMLIRQVSDISRSTPLVPPDYAEWGIQFDYENIDWLGVSLGFFDAKNLSHITLSNLDGESVSVVDSNTMSTVLRVGFYPELSDGITTFFGGTYFINSPLKTDNGIYYGNNYFYIANLFFNVGISDMFSLMTEYCHSEKQSLRKTDNFMVELTYQLKESVLPYVRLERGTTEYPEQGTFNTNQYVFGAHIVLLPYIEILPEYRIYDREWVDGYSAQWAFQLHMYY